MLVGEGAGDDEDLLSARMGAGAEPGAGPEAQQGDPLGCEGMQGHDALAFHHARLPWALARVENHDRGVAGLELLELDEFVVPPEL